MRELIAAGALTLALLLAGLTAVDAKPSPASTADGVTPTIVAGE